MAMLALPNVAYYTAVFESNCDWNASFRSWFSTKKKNEKLRNLFVRIFATINFWRNIRDICAAFQPPLVDGSLATRYCWYSPDKTKIMFRQEERPMRQRAKWDWTCNWNRSMTMMLLFAMRKWNGKWKKKRRNSGEWARQIVPPIDTCTSLFILQRLHTWLHIDDWARCKCRTTNVSMVRIEWRDKRTMCAGHSNLGMVTSVPSSTKNIPILIAPFLFHLPFRCIASVTSNSI